VHLLSARARKPRSTAIGAAICAVVALVLTACSSGSPGTQITVTKQGGGTSTITSGAPTSTKPTGPPPKPVHIKSLLAGGGETYGVGMPVIVFFSKKIKSAKALQAATKVTVNGHPLNGGWYFETSSYYKTYPIEGHWRPQHYWQPHTQVHVAINAKGVSAGAGLAFNDSLSLDFRIGASHLGTVNDISHTITIISDGHSKYTFPVSLGASNTPTRHGYKVIMEKLPTVCMHDIAGTYYECGIKLDQRLTYDGEYLHAAPWNVSNITHGVDSSNGCTNLLPNDAKTLFDFMQVGDVVDYPNANGKQMGLGDGYGDWNVSWGAWLTGGLVPTV
jgi:lipoprotein-anchoring transpeptidase ErfK/SrfK